MPVTHKCPYRDVLECFKGAITTDVRNMAAWLKDNSGSPNARDIRSRHDAVSKLLRNLNAMTKAYTRKK